MSGSVNARIDWGMPLSEERREVPVTQHLVLRTDGVAIERLTEIRDSLRESLEQKDAVQKQAYQRMEEQKRGRITR